MREGLRSRKKKPKDVDSVSNDVDSKKADSDVKPSFVEAKSTQKSFYVAFAFWLVGGWSGLHHFYFGDDTKVFLYFISFGGFGLAVLRDLWNLSSYADPKDETNPKRKSFPLMLAAFLFSYYFNRILTLAFAPEDLTFVGWEVLVRGFTSALGAYLVITTGTRKVDLKHALLKAWAVSCVVQFVLVAILPSFDTYMYASLIPSVHIVAALSASVFLYKYRHFGAKKVQPSSNVCVRWTKLCFFVSLFWLIVLAAIVLNAKIDIEDAAPGEPKEMFLRTKLFHGKRWDEVDWSEVFKQFILGLEEIARLTMEGLDTTQAYETLELREGASMAEVKKRFRHLARTEHPDKHPEQRKKYEQKFAKIQTAYNFLIDRFGRMNSEEEIYDL